MMWHVRLRHLGECVLQSLVKQGLLKGAKIGKVELCEYWIVGKQTKVKFDSFVDQTKESWTIYT